MAVDKEKWIVEPHTPWQETTPGGIIPTSGNEVQGLQIMLPGMSGFFHRH